MTNCRCIRTTTITGGEIDIGGRVVNRLEPKDRDIAMVFQNYALYPHMTVRDNMSFALMLARQSKKEIDMRVKKAADILGLSELLSRYPRQLSGGQRQRVAMGRAIVRDPQVINGCSDLMVNVLGDAGRHARSAVGTGSLPNRIMVEIEAILLVKT